MHTQFWQWVLHEYGDSKGRGGDKNNIVVDLKERGCKCVGWMELSGSCPMEEESCDIMEKRMKFYDG
jgi:hypothetical protein